MPEGSIVIKTQDKSSEGMKTIAKNADALGSKLRSLQDRAHALSKEKAMLSVDCDRAKKELTDAKKKFNETQDALDGLKVEAAQSNLDNLSYQFRSVSKEAEKARKRAVAYILSLELPADEAACITECDVRGRSCVQVAQALHLSVDGLAKLRRRAYKKIASEQKGSAD